MNLSIVYFNDVHGYMEEHPEVFYKGGSEIIKTVGGYARIAGYIQQVKSKQPALVFDGGDTFHGALPVVQSKGQSIIGVLNDMQIDAMVGHWDFAYGPKQLKHLAAQLNYPLLGINIYNDDGSLFLKPYMIRQVEKCNVAVIGICSNIINKTMPKQFSEGLRITDGSVELPAYIKKVKEEGANLIILLSHNGFPQDYELVSKLAGIDICLSAHTHNRLYEAIKINDTLIIQCGCHGSFLGHLDVEIENDTIINYHYQLKTVDDSFPDDKGIAAKVKTILAPYASLQSEVLGNTPRLLHRYNILNTSMDNLLLASMQWQTGTNLVFSNGWRYGIPIEKGPISKYQLFNMIPHNPLIETVELTGEEIWQMLEENLERTFSANPMKQMGGYVKRCWGLTAYIKIENPRSHRIQELFIGNHPCQKQKLYTASFVTEQSVPENYGQNRKKTEKHIVDSMADFVRAGLLTNVLIEKKAIICI